MTRHREYIAPAQLNWQGEQPVSGQFDDIYFSADGAQEVQRVFLQPSKVVERASAMASPWFTIAELDGSGLNFIVSADEVLRKTDKTLHFISVEAHPLTPSDWRKVAALRPRSQQLRHSLSRPCPCSPVGIGGPCIRGVFNSAYSTATLRTDSEI